jgi:hypothetical protein
MPLRQCPECGREISDRASSCPQCGSPTSPPIVTPPTPPPTAQIPSNAYVCRNCEQLVSPNTGRQGSCLIEIVLWLLFLIPGLIYTLWRFSRSNQTCPVCGAVNTMVPANTQAGREIASRLSQEALASGPVVRSSGTLITLGGLGLVVIIVAMAVYMSDLQEQQRVEEDADVIEQRQPIRNGVNVRTGPGTNFSLDRRGPLSSRETLYVVEERNGWVRFRVTPEDLGWSGWAAKRLTQPVPGQRIERTAPSP